MCGLIGGFWQNAPADLQSRLQKGLVALKHRGPDDRGQWLHRAPSGTLALGHTRLAIIDLSANGHQPMHSADGRFSIVFNGEIYNYPELREELQAAGHLFRTDSDTEVLLTCWMLWGKACLPKLSGMFSFVVYDSFNNTLTCIRDAFGIKPFYYSLVSSRFAFASEAPALLSLLPEKSALNLQRAYDYLVYGSYDNQESTFYEGIQHLLPGHVMTLALSQETLAPSIERWWWPSIEERSGLSFQQAAEELREVFLQNIRLHLRSDVALGVALSGGVDSSAVVCAMRHLEPCLPIHTFSYVARCGVEDEETWVDLVNGRAGAIPHKVVVAPDELASDIDDIIRAQGEPFGSTSIYAQYRVFRRAKEQGVKVTLDGQGADELLAGYHGYPVARMRSLLERGDVAALVRFINGWSRWPGRSKQLAFLLLGAALVPDSLQPLARRLIGQSPAPAWIDVAYLREAGVMPRLMRPQPSPHASGRRMTEALRSALTGNGLSSLLRHDDRNSMRWSIESRVPFLTTDLAAFLLSLPEDYLLSSQGETKRIFRAAMRGIVPDATLDRRDKIGFQTPELRWLQTLGPRVFEWLDGADNVAFLRSDTCRREVRAIVDGRKAFSSSAWRLINYCRWVQLSNAFLV